jgi:hypothetical protein
MKRIFESCDPKQFMSVGDYCKGVINLKDYSDYIQRAIANKTELGHMRREICINCGLTYGEHYGDAGKLPRCDE